MANGGLFSYPGAAMENEYITDEEIENDPGFWAALFNFGRGKINEAIIQQNWQYNYLDYIKSTPWKEKCKSIKLARGNKCQVCGSGNNLQVHHNTYDRLGCEDDNDLVLLCKSCHFLFHRSK